ncbi:hypothetical protein FBEOM_2334 [Fusarium beomiforme]|uniref:F-box domain-containing protein n=1 Tax=Fusarium beomiforme TaxID=44412 RepID=A0A9P5ATX2_9HYPO|nr:hypothetical protein FBEOM_2334 [Fusarium beomiforme]
MALPTITPVSKLVSLLSDKFQSLNLNIVDNILFHLGIADIYALHATSRSLRWLVGYMTDSPSLLNVNKQLRLFVKDPLRFRSELGRTDGLIAGDFVCNFFEYGTYKDFNHLHVYVDKGGKWLAFITYLLNVEGYRYQSELEPYCFERQIGTNVCIITVKRTDGPPIIDIINTATTTLDLNIISWNKAYSLLPRLNIAHHKFYPLKTLNNEVGQVLHRRYKWGWTTRDLLWPDLTQEFLPANGCRQVGGKYTLAINLGGLPREYFTPDHDYVLEGAVYSLVHQMNSRGRPLSASIQPMKKSIGLKYVHTNGASGLHYKDWEEFFEDRLNRWVYVEIAKTHRLHNRPPSFVFLEPGNFRVNIPPNYEPPRDDWDYADDQVILWFREWERNHKH